MAVKNKLDYNQMNYGELLWGFGLGNESVIMIMNAVQKIIKCYQVSADFKYWYELNSLKIFYLHLWIWEVLLSKCIHCICICIHCRYTFYQFMHGMHSLGTRIHDFSFTSVIYKKNLHFTTTVKNVCNLYSKMIQGKKWLFAL